MKNTALKINNDLTPLSADEFESRLRDIGKERYHDNCKFHHLLHSGKLNKGQVQAWALNRYYYQINISIKDSALMSRIKDPELRRVWIKRILDHDGRKDDEGGIERWYKLTDGLDMDREYVKSTKGILPATRFSVDAYVTFVKEKSLLEGVTSSLTELFAPKIHKERIVGMLENYDFINDQTMAYFKKRVDQATDDADFVLDYAIKNAHTRQEQEDVCEALKFKTDVLWVMQDALYHSYINGHVPPGAFMPEDLMTDILTIDGDIVPKFPKHVKFKYNEPRKEWVLLAPEKLVKPDQIAVEILKLVDGIKTVKKIANELSQKFNAPEEVIIEDTKVMLQQLADKGFIVE